MTQYAARKISSSVYEITTGRKKVGFIRACPAGFVARIGTVCETAPTAIQAFDLVVAKTLGFATPAAMEQHNVEVRARNAALRAEMHQAVGAMKNGNFEPFLDLLAKS
jgi:hypothetical protein